MAVYANPANACQEIQGPPNNTDYHGNWIVLIRRYNCSFEVKIRNAQKAKYNAVIVHNVNSNELGKLDEYYIITKMLSIYIKCYLLKLIPEPMSAKDNTGISIPAVFVGDVTGLVIKENYLYDQSYFLLINDDLPFNINTHLLLPFAIVVGICFLIIVIFMVSYRYDTFKFCIICYFASILITYIVYYLYCIDC